MGLFDRFKSAKNTEEPVEAAEQVMETAEAAVEEAAETAETAVEEVVEAAADAVPAEEITEQVTEAADGFAEAVEAPAADMAEAAAEGIEGVEIPAAEEIADQVTDAAEGLAETAEAPAGEAAEAAADGIEAAAEGAEAAVEGVEIPAEAAADTAGDMFAGAEASITDAMPEAAPEIGEAAEIPVPDFAADTAAAEAELAAAEAAAAEARRAEAQAAEEARQAALARAREEEQARWEAENQQQEFEEEQASRSDKPTREERRAAKQQEKMAGEQLERERIEALAANRYVSDNMNTVLAYDANNLIFEHKRRHEEYVLDGQSTLVTFTNEKTLMGTREIAFWEQDTREKNAGSHAAYKKDGSISFSKREADSFYHLYHEVKNNLQGKVLFFAPEKEYDGISFDDTDGVLEFIEGRKTYFVPYRDIIGVDLDTTTKTIATNKNHVGMSKVGAASTTRVAGVDGDQEAKSTTSVEYYDMTLYLEDSEYLLLKKHYEAEDGEEVQTVFQAISNIVKQNLGQF